MTELVSFVLGGVLTGVFLIAVQAVKHVFDSRRDQANWDRGADDRAADRNLQERLESKKLIHEFRKEQVRPVLDALGSLLLSANHQTIIDMLEERGVDITTALEEELPGSRDTADQLARTRASYLFEQLPLITHENVRHSVLAAATLFSTNNADHRRTILNAFGWQRADEAVSNAFRVLESYVAVLPDSE